MNSSMKKVTRKILVSAISLSLFGTTGYFSMLSKVNAFKYDVSNNTYINETFNLSYKIPNDAYVLPKDIFESRYEGELNRITSSKENVQLAVASNSYNYFFDGYEAYIITESANHKREDQIVNEKLSNVNEFPYAQGFYNCEINGIDFKGGWIFSPNECDGSFDKILVTVKDDQAFIIFILHPAPQYQNLYEYREHAVYFAEARLPEFDGHFYSGFSDNKSVTQ